MPISGPSGSVNGVRIGTPLNTGAAVSEGSPPKRPKVEWDGQPNEELRKEQQEVENIQTVEDTNAFMDRVTEMWKAASEGGVGQQEFIMSKINETLALILKSDSTDDAADASALASTSLLNAGSGGGGGGQQDSSTEQTPLPASVVDEFVELFDFSSWEPMDGGSKPPTPDLVSSSTNPSPESAGGAEADASASAATATTGLAIATGTTTAVKTMDLIEPSIYESSSDFDVFGSGIWKEIDGGESEYWSRSEWEWDRPMA